MRMEWLIDNGKSIRAARGVATIHTKLVLQDETDVDYSDAMFSSVLYVANLVLQFRLR